MSIKDKAIDYLRAGLSVIPANEDKLPAIAWKPYQSQRLTEAEAASLFAKSKALAIICGAISGGLEVIDVDTKYDSSGSLWKDLKTLLEDNLPELSNSLVIAQTKSGGYHLYYRCSSIAGNSKLALKLNKEVLIETRGEGGYVLAAPSAGYSYINGKPENIPTIGPEARELLLSICKSFNELEEAKPKSAPAEPYTSSGLSPFDDYNERGDVVGLLESKGWTVVNKSGERVYLRRAGQTDSKTSGNFHTGMKVLRVFSSSTDFDTDKGYSPSSVFALLECKGDNKEAYRRLLELGYGEPYQKQPKSFNGLSKLTDGELVLIEEELDSITAKELSNVVATGGRIAPEQIRDAIAKGANSFTVCFDNKDAILSALKVIRGVGVDRVYIVSLPASSYIKANGVEAFKKALTKRLSYGAYLGSTMYTEFTSKLTDGEIDYKDRDLVREKAVELRYGMSPADRDDFNRALIEPLRSLGFEEIILIQLEEDLKEKRAEADRVRSRDKLIAELQRPDSRGKEDKIVEDWLKATNVQTGSTLEPPPTSFTQLLTDISFLPPAYSTGYRKLDEVVGFTPASISLIAGRPSHGKTTLLFNILLEMSRRYTKESFYFFSYEEPKANITVKLLNRLTAIDLSPHYREIRDLAKPTNYEFIKAYIRHRRTDIAELEEAKKQLGELVDSGRIVIIDQSYTVEDLKALLFYLNGKKKIGAVLIDYIQKLRTKRQSPDMRLEIANISNTLLNTAKDTGLPLILGAQLNRAAATGGGDKQPKLENLKEAGNLEEDANTVISVYNKAREEEAAEDGTKYSDLREVELELKVLKNREGEPNAKRSLWLDKWTGVLREDSMVDSLTKPY